MALDPCFLTMTNDTLSMEEPSTFNKFGAPGFGVSVTGIPVRLEVGARRVISKDGIERIASGTLFVLSTSASMSVDTKITLSDGSTPEILRVDVLNDEEGQHHIEVALR